MILHGAGQCLVVQCPELGSLTSEAQHDTQPEHQDPVSHVARSSDATEQKAHTVGSLGNIHRVRRVAGLLHGGSVRILTTMLAMFTNISETETCLQVTASVRMWSALPAPRSNGTTAESLWGTGLWGEYVAGLR